MGPPRPPPPPPQLFPHRMPLAAIPVQAPGNEPFWAQIHAVTREPHEPVFIRLMYWIPPHLLPDDDDLRGHDQWIWLECIVVSAYHYVDRAILR